MADPMMLANSGPALVPAAATPLELVGRSPAIARAEELVRRAAALDAGVLLVAERGADVGAVARELHARSRPPTSPWVVVECGSADGGALERLLFGVVVGDVPTDLEAVSADSRVAAARGGTLFLHDVSELPAAIQARLARIARDGEVRIDGEPASTNLRFVASAAPSIDADIRDHRFRPDLYRRLAASRIDLPPLRDRAEDIAPLAERLLEELSVAGGTTRRFTEAALAVLSALSWPGNLAELRMVVERIVALPTDGVIQVEQVLPALQLDRSMTAFAPAGSLRQARLRFERDYIAAVLQHHGWKVAEAAQTLGIQRPNLYRKARQLGIPVTRLSEVVKQ
jgi:DNA-binding NtrC family response regulator